ncbi:MAG: hypothetical protein HYY93_13360 [Planctomycetes bacterium]|nr:hypothetical protein [Planctomycetota bacterium]
MRSFRRRRALSAAFGIALVAFAGMAWSAIFLPSGDESPITAIAPGVAAEAPAVALATDGRSFVVYQSANGDLGEIPGTQGVYLIQVASTDSVIGLQRLNTVVAGDEREPDVACATDGRCIAVWVEETGGTFRIRLRRFAADGSALSPVEDTLVGPTALRLSTPRISGDGSGAFVVTWAEEVAAGDTDVFAQILDISATPLTGVLAVNTGVVAGVQNDPSVSMNSVRDFVVGWTDESGADTSGKGIFVRAFSGTGAPLFAEFVAPLFIGGDQVDSSVFLREEGTFVVAWTVERAPPLTDLEKLRFFSATGVTLAAEIGADSGVAALQDRTKPRLAGDAAGNFLIAWETAAPVPAPPPPDDTPLPVLVRRFDGANSAQQADLEVSARAVSPAIRIVTDPDVSVDPGGSTVFVWVDATDGGSLYTRRFSLRDVSDRDGDNLADSDELAIGSNPDRADTDLDGLDDFTEVGSSLFSPKDTDGDGAVDFLEPGPHAASAGIIRLIFTPAQLAERGYPAAAEDSYLQMITSGGNFSYTSSGANRTPLRTESEVSTQNPDFSYPQGLLVFSLNAIPLPGQGVRVEVTLPRSLELSGEPIWYTSLSPNLGWRIVHDVDGITDGDARFTVLLRDGDFTDGDTAPNQLLTHVGGVGYKDPGPPLVVQKKDVIGAGGGGGSGGCFIETITR